ncbi:hypothetical protein AHAS_Ahas15G0344800 [Arachis hypogaea]
MLHEKNQKNDQRSQNKGKAILEVNSDNYGLWMVVQKHRRNRKEIAKDGAGPSNPNREKEHNTTSKTRFSVLETEQTNTEEEDKNDTNNNENLGAQKRKHNAWKAVQKAQISNETNTREFLSKSHNKQNQEGNTTVAEA